MNKPFFAVPYIPLICDQLDHVFSNLEISIAGKMFLNVPKNAATAIAVPGKGNR